MQGLKPDAYFAAFSARVNSCPFTNHLTCGVFSQAVKPDSFMRVCGTAEAVPFQNIVNSRIL
jgi:hypothetical protein